MYAPRTHHPGFHVAPSLKPFVLGLAAVVLAIGAWAALTTRPTSNEQSFAVSVIPPASTVRSVAYAVPRAGFDAVYIRNIDSSAAPRFVASFPTILNWRLRGFASPIADRLALLYVDSIEGTTARLTVLDLPGGHASEAEGVFDYDAAVAWAPNGTTVAAVRSTNHGGERSAAVIEYNPGFRTTTELARFEGAVEVAPIGYALGDSRLLVVVVDQSGSSLWSVRAGAKERLARFSAGPTAQWSLSPDGSRLAFVDRVGLGTRTFAGRVLVLATGLVTDVPARADQLGAAWRPGSVAPDFGGPGGSLQLSDPSPGDYVVPVGWSPDGTSLVAEIYRGDHDRAQEPPSLELVSPVHRQRLADEDGALFFGWIRNVE